MTPVDCGHCGAHYEADPVAGHRVMCGDSTRAPDVEALVAGAQVDAVITDPPYCSGGFQEAGRAQGSIGTSTKITPRIANDTLSTRGYQSLLKSVLSLAPTSLIYVFTDWRMWTSLFDVAESSGYGVRNMIVWNKGTPGMGMGWRSQHELVLYGASATVKFDNHKAVGNVVSLSRTGNPLHPTQKPVDLILTILDVTDMAERIYDPFGGSGSTLIACHDARRRAYLMELDPAYVDVTCARFQAHTGTLPVLESTGQAHDFTPESGS